MVQSQGKRQQVKEEAADFSRKSEILLIIYVWQFDSSVGTGGRWKAVLLIVEYAGKQSSCGLIAPSSGQHVETHHVHAEVTAQWIPSYLHRCVRLWVKMVMQCFGLLPTKKKVQLNSDIFMFSFFPPRHQHGRRAETKQTQSSEAISRFSVQVRDIIGQINCLFDPCAAQMCQSVTSNVTSANSNVW